MKKIFTFAVSALFALGVQAQANLFDAADVDADGWLWFDTQEKIDKYVGLFNEDDAKVNPDGKLIQLVYADQYPDYVNPTADPTLVGVGTDGNTGGEGHKTGAILLTATTALFTFNGGGFIVCMPSCKQYDICMSSESTACFLVSDTTSVDATYGNDQEVGPSRSRYSVSKWTSKYYAGINTVTLSDKNNGYKLSSNMQSNDPVYVMFRNGTKDTLYIHGIRVITNETAGIRDIAADSNAKTAVYSLDGKLMGSSTSEADLNKGLYIIRQGEKSKKVVIK